MRVLSDWLLTPERLAIHLPTATAVAADLHLGYDRARQRRGEAIPLAGLDDLLQALAALVSRHGVRRLAVAGDLFEDAAGRALIPDLLDGLRARDLDLTGVVPGNHDRGLTGAGSVLPLYPDGLHLGEWLVVHGDGPVPDGPVVLGHFHPCFRWERRQVVACYLVGDNRLILPAFSPDAAGMNVLRSRRWRTYRCAVPVGAEVLDFGPLADLAAATRDRGLLPRR